MRTRVLGGSGLEVSTIGLGCMGFSDGYGPGPDADASINLIRHAFDLGCTFFDTAESYGSGANEELVGRALSLARLGTDHVELYDQHRVNKDIAVEDVAGCMGELIARGKIIGWGQSQATEDELRRAHAVTPPAAIQSEYSIMERMVEKECSPPAPSSASASSRSARWPADSCPAR